MGVRSVQPPARQRGRRTPPPLDEKETKEAVKILSVEVGAACGPDETFDTEKQARKVIGQWYRHLKDQCEFPVGTRAWTEDDGKWSVVLVHTEE